MLHLILLLLTSFFSQIHGQSCYYPNGDLVVAEGVAPCSSSGDSMCCPLNWACSSNQLCMYQQGEDTLFGRYSCTDETWNSSSCANFCLTENGASAGNQAVVRCPNESYCCDGDRSFDCCTKAGTTFFALRGGSIINQITSVLPLGTATSSTTAPRTTTTTPRSVITTGSTSVASTDVTAALPSSSGASISHTSTGSAATPSNLQNSIPSSNPSNSSKTSTLGLILGLVFGAIIGVAALLFCHYIRYRIRRKRRAQARATAAKKPNPSTGTSPEFTRSWTSLWGQQGQDDLPHFPGPQLLLPELTEEEISVVPGRLEMPDDAHKSVLSPMSRFNSPVPAQLDNRVSMISDTSTRPGSLISQQVPQYLRYYNTRNSAQLSEHQSDCENADTIGEIEGAHSPTVSTVRPVYELPGDEP